MIFNHTVIEQHEVKFGLNTFKQRVYLFELGNCLDILEDYSVADYLLQNRVWINLVFIVLALLLNHNFHIYINAEVGVVRAQIR